MDDVRLHTAPRSAEPIRYGGNAALDGPAPDPRAVAHLTIPAAADRIMASLAPLLR